MGSRFRTNRAGLNTTNLFFCVLLTQGKKRQREAKRFMVVEIEALNSKHELRGKRLCGHSFNSFRSETTCAYMYAYALKGRMIAD